MKPTQVTTPAETKAPASPAKHDLRKVGASFDIPGTFISASPYGSGHINDTYAATYEGRQGHTRYIHQRINHQIFQNPVSLMQNIARVTMHQRRKLRAAGSRDLDRRALTIIPSRAGHAHHQDDEGNFWRTYIFVEGASTHDSIKSEEQARQAARAFGEFQKTLLDLPGQRLHETIPHFHDTPKRLETLIKAVEADAHNRAKEARPEIDFILNRRALAFLLADKQKAGLIPERITHNDTKLNNVMLDDVTMEGVCVIDLDTVMPGLVLHDFGDMVRTATSPRPEDERDLSSIHIQMPMFRALVDGYLTAASSFLTPIEKDCLAASGKLITLEIGMRFLTDFLEGDGYFKIKRPGHNLDRSRTQLRLVESIEEHEDEMYQAVTAWMPRT